MRVFWPVLLFAVVLLSLGAVHAFSMMYVSVTDTVYQYGVQNATSHINYTLTASTNLSSITVPISTGLYGVNVNPSTIHVYQSGSQYPFDLNTSLPNYILINLNGVTPGAKFVITYSYSVAYSNTTTLFQAVYPFSAINFTNVNISIILPLGGYLPNISQAQYSPRAPTNFMSNGRNIEIFWRLGLSQSFVAPYNLLPYQFSAYYQANFKNVSYAPSPITTPKTSSSYNDYIYGGIVAAAVIIATIALFVLKKKRPKKPLKKGKNSPFIRLLTEDERKVFNSLKRGQFTLQAEVLLSTGFSKSKLSKILSKLVKYKLVKIKSEGRINRIKRT